MGHHSVVSGKSAVRSHTVLAIATRWPETEWCRNIAEGLRRQRPAKFKQQGTLVTIGWHLQRHSVEHGSNYPDTAAQPTNSAGQVYVWPAQRAGSGLEALSNRRCGNAVFDRSEQASHPGREKVRQQAERATAFGTIPPRDTQPSRRYSRVAAAAGKRAAACGVKRATRQAGGAPFAVPDVSFGVQRCS